MEQINEAILSRSPALFFYSPYNFVRAFAAEQQLEKIVYPDIRSFASQPGNTVIPVKVANSEYAFYVSLLAWDTKYFGARTIKLRYVLYTDGSLLREAVKLFMENVLAEPGYCFIEIPTEDIQLIQALTANSFRLIETRMTYFRGQLESFNEPRYEVRKATSADAANLMRVARGMRNDFDRFHADPFFEKEKADEFLATYIEQSLNGFADMVLTPTHQPDSFLTAKYLKDEWERNGFRISKMVLSAVSDKTNKGWYRKLIGEMTIHLKEEGADYIYMNTQSTNRAVIHTWETLGYRLGCCTHVLSYAKIQA